MSKKKEVAKTPEEQIRFHLDQKNAGDRSSIEHAHHAGGVFNSQKTKLDHGEFEGWCEKHCPEISNRHIERYMELNRELTIEQVLGCTSFREAKKMIPKKPNATRVSFLPDKIMGQINKLLNKLTEAKETQSLTDLRDMLLLIVPIEDAPAPPPGRISKPEVMAVFSQYQVEHPSAKLNEKREKLIKSRLKDGYSVDELRTAIIGHHRSPFHTGENDSGKEYLRLGLALDPDKIDGFIEMATADLSVYTETQRRNARAIDNAGIEEILRG